MDSMGIVQVLAGVMTMKGIVSGNIYSSVFGIADAVDPRILDINYPMGLGAIFGQNGFNLFLIGFVTTIAALTGGLANVGCFLFMDLGGYVNFVPGNIMTVISASAIILSFYGYIRSSRMS